jgi:hypothetical protein
MGDQDGQRPADRVPSGGTADAGTGAPRVLLDIVRRLRARERGHLAALLHDGPIQDLATIALELGEVRRALREAQRDDSDVIERQVDAIGRDLGRLQDELWPFPRPGSGLVSALQRRTAWLLSTPPAVVVGEGTAELPEADIQAVADLVELILAVPGTAGAWDQAIAEVRASPDLIFLDLTMTAQPGGDPDGADPDCADPDCADPDWADPAAAAASLCRLAAALHARADLPADGCRLRMCLEIPRWLPITRSSGCSTAPRTPWCAWTAAGGSRW